MGNMMTLSGIILLAVLTSHVFGKTLKASDIVFVVLSQSDNYHSELALSLRRDIRHQASILTKDPPVVRLSHEELNHHGAWTIIPILSMLQVHDGANSSWIIFCEERTRFNLEKLLLVLSKYDSSKEQWLGHRLSDKEPSIIHHFVLPDSPEFVEYPLFASGFAMSTALVNSLADRAKNKTSTDFSMDAAHELAMFIRIPLVHLPSSFCLQNKPECASYPLQFQPCGELVPKDDVYFAVKTCLKFHKDRIPVVKDTWGKNAKHIEYFSDYKDDNIPTTVVNVPNVNTGHCSKTFTIFKLILERAKDLPNLRWLFLADDDTILSVSRLQSLLTCWENEEVVLGERYGYNIYSESGYNYVTGGGGTAIHISLLPSIVTHCQCIKDNFPDDMYLGYCLSRLGIQVVHSPLFHQARPTDYSKSYLATQFPVSFHKHWMVDPIAVYKEWFSSDDNPLPSQHIEL